MLINSTTGILELLEYPCKINTSGEKSMNGCLKYGDRCNVCNDCKSTCNVDEKVTRFTKRGYRLKTIIKQLPMKWSLRAVSIGVVGYSLEEVTEIILVLFF